MWSNKNWNVLTQKWTWHTANVFFLILLSASSPPSSACALIFQMNRIKISPRWRGQFHYAKNFQSSCGVGSEPILSCFWFVFSQDIMATWRHILLQQVSGNSTFLTKKKVIWFLFFYLLFFFGIAVVEIVMVIMFKCSPWLWFSPFSIGLSWSL